MYPWGYMYPRLGTPALEGLIEFLPFLVPKLWPKTANTLGDPDNPPGIS